MTASEWASEAGRATLTRQPRFAARKAARSLARSPSFAGSSDHARTHSRARCYFRKLFPKSVVACMHVRPSHTTSKDSRTTARRQLQTSYGLAEDTTEIIIQNWACSPHTWIVRTLQFCVKNVNAKEEGLSVVSLQAILQHTSIT